MSQPGRTSLSRPRSSGVGLVGGLFRTLWLLVVLLTPLLSTWFSSSLAAAHGAPVWLAASAGLLLFPVLPLAWELRASVRHARARIAARRPRWSTRLTLRTLALNLLFLGVVLAVWPKPLFHALSTRGDWMLPPGGGDERVALARRTLFDTADALEWAYVLARQDPYADHLTDAHAVRPEVPPTPSRPRPVPEREPVPPSSDATRPAPAPQQPEHPAPQQPEPAEPSPEQPARTEPDAQVAETGAKGEGEDEEEGGLIEISWKDTKPAQPQAQAPSEGPRSTPEEPGRARPPPEAGPRVRGDRAPWPFEPTLHPLVAQLPSHVETDLASVARYLVSRERDPYQRVKALHDYVADRVAYDGKAYRTRQFPPQNAEEVFRTRLAVCAGYTNLFVAMGQAAGEEIVALRGDSRNGLGALEGLEAHAWSAARIEGRWYLIDVTWDAGYLEGDTFVKKYKTGFLMTPPELFLARHFPDEPAWQLLPQPVSRGDFLRRAIVEPIVFTGSGGDEAVYEAGVRILEPGRSQVEAQGRFSLRLENPRRLMTQVRVVRLKGDGADDAAAGGDCVAASETSFDCTVPDRGLYRVQVFAGPATTRTLQRVAVFDVTNS